MKVSLDDLDRTDRLTSTDFPWLDEDEWIEIHRVFDFHLETQAEAAAWEQARAAADEHGAPPPARIDFGLLVDQQFEAMLTGWNLYDGTNGEGGRLPLPCSPENRRRFVARFGIYLAAEIGKRRGATAGPPVKTSGPDGEAPSFPQGA